MHVDCSWFLVESSMYSLQDLAGHVLNLGFCICSLTGGIGTPGLNTSVGSPAASMFGASMAAAPLMQPVGVLPGAPLLPIISQSADIGTPTEFLLLKNMFDPAVEVYLFLYKFMFRSILVSLC